MVLCWTLFLVTWQVKENTKGWFLVSIHTGYKESVIIVAKVSIAIHHNHQLLESSDHYVSKRWSVKIILRQQCGQTQDYIQTAEKPHYIAYGFYACDSTECILALQTSV